jgi:hypothetical protein
MNGEMSGCACSEQVYNRFAPLCGAFAPIEQSVSGRRM